MENENKIKYRLELCLYSENWSSSGYDINREIVESFAKSIAKSYPKKVDSIVTRYWVSDNIKKKLRLNKITKWFDSVSTSMYCLDLETAEEIRTMFSLSVSSTKGTKAVSNLTKMERRLASKPFARVEISCNKPIMSKLLKKYSTDRVLKVIKKFEGVLKKKCINLKMSGIRL
jgi:hypothetical protein